MAGLSVELSEAAAFGSLIFTAISKKDKESKRATECSARRRRISTLSADEGSGRTAADERERNRNPDTRDELHQRCQGGRYLGRAKRGGRTEAKRGELRRTATRGCICIRRAVARTRQIARLAMGARFPKNRPCAGRQESAQQNKECLRRSVINRSPL